MSGRLSLHTFPASKTPSAASRLVVCLPFASKAHPFPKKNKNRRKQTTTPPPQNKDVTIFVLHPQDGPEGLLARCVGDWRPARHEGSRCPLHGAGSFQSFEMGQFFLFLSFFNFGGGGGERETNWKARISGGPRRKDTHMAMRLGVVNERNPSQLVGGQKSLPIIMSGRGSPSPPQSGHMLEDVRGVSQPWLFCCGVSLQPSAHYSSGLF